MGDAVGRGAAVTALRPLPPCPACGLTPNEWKCNDVRAWSIACPAPLKSAAYWHEIHVSRPTRRAVRALWRRIAGGSR